MNNTQWIKGEVKRVETFSLRIFWLSLICFVLWMYMYSGVLGATKMICNAPFEEHATRNCASLIEIQRIHQNWGIETRLSV